MPIKLSAGIVRYTARTARMKKWSGLFLVFCYLISAAACSYIPSRRRRSTEERVREGVRNFKKGAVRIKGKDEPGRLF